MNRVALVVLTLATLAVAAAPRAALAAPFGLGPRAGFSAGPDQFVVGLGLVRPLSPRIELSPGLDFGFGGDAFTIALNGDMRVNVVLESNLKPYVGFGITWFTVNPDADGADTYDEVGGSLLAGIWINRGHWPELNAEARLGLGDVPDFKAMLGFSVF